jgi:hypothetical protein
MQLFVKNYHWIWNMVLSIWSQKQMTKFAMETANTQESLHAEITNEDNAQHFLWYQEYCSLSIHSIRSNSQPSLLCGNTTEVMWTDLLHAVN